MARILGIEFAPLSIPTERRLQTLGVLQWVMTFLVAGFGSLFFCIYLCFTDYYWIPAIYFIWWLYDRPASKRSGGRRRIEWIRRLKMWHYFRDYFPLKLVKTAELDPNKNYIFGYHPHGIMSVGAFLVFAVDVTGFTTLFPGLRATLLTLEGQFKFPFFREYFLTSGACDCSKESIRYLLSECGVGNALGLVVGGATEALEARPHNYVLRLKHRKGFVKLALQHGASLVPVYSFGENEMFLQVANPKGSFLRTFQDLMTKYVGFSPPFFHGRGVFNYTFGLLPFRRPVNVVVGKPLHTDRIVAPSTEQIDELHDRYISALNELFDENKDNYGVEKDVHLTIT